MSAKEPKNLKDIELNSIELYNKIVQSLPAETDSIELYIAACHLVRTVATIILLRNIDKEKGDKVYEYLDSLIDALKRDIAKHKPNFEELPL